MKGSKSKSSQYKELRKQAEEFLNKNRAAFKKAPYRDLRNLIEDLQIHQIELEMQNDELQKVKLELEDSRDKYFDLYELAPVGYVVLDKKGYILDANFSIIRQLSVEDKWQLIGKALPSFLATKNRDVLYFHLKEVFETGARQTSELEFVKKDGTGFYAQLESIAVKDAEGNFSQCRTSLSDITERVLAKEALLEYRRAVEGCEDLITALDRKYVHILANEAFLRYHCLDRDQVIGHSLAEVMGKEVFELVIKPKADRCLKGESVDYEMKYQYPDYGERYMLVSYYPLKDDDGEVTGIMSIFRDISVPQMAAEGLRDSQERYRILAENISDVVWSMDMKRRFTYFSPSVERLRGYTPEEAMAQTMEESMTPASFVKTMEIFKIELDKHYKGERDPEMPVTFELELTCKDGGTVWTELAVNFIYDSTGQPSGIIGTTRDITKRRKIEEALRGSEERYRSMTDSMINKSECDMKDKTRKDVASP
jgi:PAS domain S-box-containing protein